MRLIDADDFIEQAYPLTGVPLERIKNATTIDAVPVVRCRECLYAQEKCGHIECLHGISYRNTWNSPDMFCSYGQRKIETVLTKSDAKDESLEADHD